MDSRQEYVNARSETDDCDGRVQGNIVQLGTACNTPKARIPSKFTFTARSMVGDDPPDEGDGCVVVHMQHSDLARVALQNHNDLRPVQEHVRRYIATFISYEFTYTRIYYT